jgi:hypothetical protein
VVAYAEAEFGMVRPFVELIYGSGDGDPTDNKLHGFMTLPVRDTTDTKSSTFFSLFEISPAFGGRDYACPARAQGVTVPGAGPQNIGTAVLGGSSGTGFAECSHSQGQPFNDRLGNPSHLGINTTYSNPGSLLIPVGAKLFPLKGHEITGWYMYRGMITTNLLEIAFNQPAGSIRQTQYHELAGYWLWTLNPYFDTSDWPVCDGNSRR